MSDRARKSASTLPRPIVQQPALHHFDGVLEQDARHGFAGSRLGQLLDMEGIDPTPEDQALGANLDREVANPPTSSILDPLNDNLDQSGWRRAH
jgi:hypothetical protein